MSAAPYRHPRPRYRAEVVFLADECDVMEMGERVAHGFVAQIPVRETTLPMLYGDWFGAVYGDTQEEAQCLI